MAGHFLAVVIQLLAGDRHLDLALGKAILQALQQAAHLGVALLHRQLEVDHRLAAQTLAYPGFQQGGAARGLLDYVANHPVHRLLGLPGETVDHQMGHQASIHQAFGHGPVVDGGDQHAALDQLIGPAARGGAQVDAGHLIRQALVPLLAGNKGVPGLLQLEGRTARRLAGELQARNAHGPQRRVIRLGDADEDLAAALERQQQARLVRILHQLAGLAQGIAQRRLELLAEIRQFLAVVSIQHLQPQAAKHRGVGQVGQQHADAVQLRQVDKHPTRPLPRENQLIETQATHQTLGAIRFTADKFGAGGTRLGLGVAGDIQAGGVLGDFRTHLVLETGAAVQQQGFHGGGIHRGSPQGAHHSRVARA